MGSHRAKLLIAAAFAGGVVGSLVAQPPSRPVFAAQSFEVLPPRRLPMPQPPSNYDSENVPVGFFSTSNRQPSPPANTNPNSWLSPPRGAMSAPAAQPRNVNPQGVTVMPLFGKPQQPVNPMMSSATPAHAPAWRWHGYGSVGGVATPFPTSVATAAAANPGLNQPEVGSTVLPMPTPVPMPMPPGPVLPNDSRLPTSLPSFPPAPAGINAVPLPTGPGEPVWKPLDSRGGFYRSQPTVTAAGVTRASGVAATTPADPWTVSRAVFAPTSEPAARPSERIAPANTSDGPLVVLRATIETVCAGRGRELEMFYRGPNNLLIRLKVRIAADAEHLANLISKLPEIAPYHVTYEIAVAP